MNATMPTIEEWTRVHTELMDKLHLPCKLAFSTDVKIGQHHFDGDDCWITVNPEIDFSVPEHLLLHEAAHHRACKIAAAYGDNRHCCWGWSGGHCEHWAKILVSMYYELNFKLPYSTGFQIFAEVAGIKHKMFEQHGKKGVLYQNMTAEVVNE
jgi:hypothetical protein